MDNEHCFQWQALLLEHTEVEKEVGKRKKHAFFLSGSSFKYVGLAKFLPSVLRLVLLLLLLLLPLLLLLLLSVMGVGVIAVVVVAYGSCSFCCCCSCRR